MCIVLDDTYLYIRLRYWFHDTKANRLYCSVINCKLALINTKLKISICYQMISRIGKICPFSNLYPTPFDFNDQRFSCNEQFYYYSKVCQAKGYNSQVDIIANDDPAKKNSSVSELEEATVIGVKIMRQFKPCIGDYWPSAPQYGREHTHGSKST